VHQGTHGIAGEWGHNPLPWQEPAEYPGERCYCGRQGCIETWLSGPSFEREYLRTGGAALQAVDIGRRAELGEVDAVATLSRYVDRLARSLAHIINVLDPDVIVLGGGMSNISHIYQTLPPLTGSYVFGRLETTPILRALHGDSSGVRGAAWLWR
jgi:fructokinase